jgi:hypothetical protein
MASGFGHFVNLTVFDPLKTLNIKTIKNNKACKSFDLQALNGIVGMAGFEPAASTSQMWRDTGLRYIPLLAYAGYCHCSNQKIKPSKLSI